MRLPPGGRFEFWTADGWLWTTSGIEIPCEEAWMWYRDERSAAEWIDLGGEG